MSRAVRADLTLGASGMDRAVGVNYVMIADTAESEGTVPAVDISYRDGAPRRSSGAVDDDFFNSSHKIKVELSDEFGNSTAKLRPPLGVPTHIFQEKHQGVVWK